MKLFTCEAVADWLALTPRRVRQLRDEGIISERLPGLYEMKPTITRYIMYLRKGSGRASLNDERALLTRAKREAAELENDLLKGSVCRMDELERGLSALCLNMRGRFSALPAKLSGELAQMGGNQAGIYDKLKAAIDETLEGLSQFTVAFALKNEDEDGEEEGAAQ